MSRYENRTEMYHEFRPDYPPESINDLFENGFLAPGMQVADIGAGTGKLTRVLVNGGLKVYCVEPDPAMRDFAAALFLDDPAVTIHDGKAEQTGLETASVDLVTAGQAFHWFDPLESHEEFRRILRTPKKFMTIDNRPTVDSIWVEIRRRARAFDIDQAFIAAQARNPEDKRPTFFEEFTLKTIEFDLCYNFEGLVQRVLSMSTKPLPGHPNHPALLDELQQLFSQHEENGSIRVRYETRICYGLI